MEIFKALTLIVDLLHLTLREELIMSKIAKAIVWWSMMVVRGMLWPWTTIKAKLTQRRICPPITNRLLLLSATELAKVIRTKQVSCTEVIKGYILRIQEVNPLLNAVVEERFEEALREAQEIDNILHSGKLSEEYLEANLPLLGLPLTVKETIAVKGMSNNGAFSLVPERRATEDAPIVRLLREAGAIVLLVSNTPELCMCWETFNPRVGITNNPYDTRRTPAGSSGGEAALLGAGASVISVASDIGGSLRLPAMFSGVYGHKPTPGFVNNRGHMPTVKDEMWDHLFTLGPMCRYAADLPIMLETIVGDKKKVLELRLREEVDLSKIKVFYMEDDGPERGYTDPVNPEIKAAMRHAVSYLHDKYGMEVKQVTIPGLVDMINFTGFIMLRMKGIPNIFQKHEDTPEEWNSMFLTFVKRMLCLTSASATCLLYGPVKSLVDRVPEEDYQKLLRKKARFMNQFQEMLGEDGVFLYPTFPDAAHPHGQIFFKFLNTAYMSIFNLLELPVTACPLGLNKNGLPIGVQISTSQKNDRLTMAVARAIEQEFGGWIPPCQVLNH